MGGMKRTKTDESVGVVIHIHMETTQGNSLCGGAYLKLVKMSCFTFYLLCFFFYKVREQEGGTDSMGWRWYWGNREEDKYCANNVHTCI
jgi:hypothetical protein